MNSRILFYNRSATFKFSRSPKTSDVFIEEVESFSGAFSRLIFERRRLDGADPFDSFLVYIDELNSDLINFLRYIKQNKPTLRLIVLVASKTSIPALKFHLNDVVSLVPENGNVEDILESLRQTA